MKRTLPLLILGLSFTLTLHSQMSIRHQTARIVPVDTTDLAYYAQKRSWIKASSLTFGVNMLIWTYDRYIQKGDFAYISLNSIKENFRKGFIWDNDYMGTNMFAHPYHGSLYYNSGRANGLNYWESGALALGGSAMWELFMECEYPSTNDIIATPIGGMIVGETLYRSSDLILDDRRTGWGRFGREAAAFIVSPMRGLTRIINGDAWRKRPTSGRQFGVPNISVEVSMGLRALELTVPVIDKGIGFAADVNIEYGERFEVETKRPFDYFSFRANLNGQGSQPLLSQLNIMGRLYCDELVDSEKDFLSIGVYQHYDYYDSDTISTESNRVPYKFCTPAAVGVGLMYQSKRHKNWNFDAYANVKGIILGASLSDHYVVNDRNYNLANGFGWTTGCSLAYKDLIGLTLIDEGYKMYTWKGYPKDINWETINEKTLNAQGDKSHAILHAISLRIDIKLRQQLYLTGVYYNYTRDTHYKYHENVFSNTHEGRLMATYKF